MTEEQQKALNAFRELIAYHRSTWTQGSAYAGNEQLVHITEIQAQIALRYEIPIGIRGTCVCGIGCPAGKVYQYVTISDTRSLKTWMSFRDMDKLPSIHANFPRHIQRRMRDYILQIMEIECPDRLPPPKPVAPILGTQGSIYSLLCIATRSLRQAGEPEQAERLWRLALNSGSYFNAVSIIKEFVDFDEAPIPKGNTAIT